MAETSASIISDPENPARWDAEAELPDRRGNMDVTFMHRVEAGLMAMMFRLFRMMSVDQASGFMGGLLKRIGPLFGGVQKRGMANLKLVYPDNTPEQNTAILSEAWENLGRTVAEYAHLEKFVPFTDGSRVEVENAEQLEALKKSGKPVIFISGHIANWEVMPITLYRAGLKCAIVYRSANNPLVDEKIIQLRASVMSRHQIPKNKRGGRAMLRSLSDGLSVCMLIDQKLNEGVPIPFLGHDAMTGLATAKMSLKFDVPVVPLSIRRHKGQARFTIHVHEPLPMSADSNAKSDTEYLTRLTNDALSEIIRDNPGQWLWFHRRWPKSATA